MNTTGPDALWSGFSDSVEKLVQDISLSESSMIDSARLRESARQTAQSFFRQCALELVQLGIEDELLHQLNELTQQLLRLSNRPNSKNAYLKVLRQLRKVIDDVTINRELKYWDRAALGYQPDVLSEIETLIYNTLNKFVPSAARSYKQAIADLSDSGRFSYRGVANELREALRETLEHLAPDQDVEAQPSFQYEKDRKAPTFKQKVRYILRARELADNAINAPEAAVTVVEDRVASFARATYDRSSISAHVASERNEVMQIKNYVNVVLAEILALHA